MNFQICDNTMVSKDPDLNPNLEPAQPDLTVTVVDKAGSMCLESHQTSNLPQIGNVWNNLKPTWMPLGGASCPCADGGPGQAGTTKPRSGAASIARGLEPQQDSARSMFVLTYGIENGTWIVIDGYIWASFGHNMDTALCWGHTSCLHVNGEPGHDGDGACQASRFRSPGVFPFSFRMIPGSGLMHSVWWEIC